MDYGQQGRRGEVMVLCGVQTLLTAVDQAYMMSSISSISSRRKDKLSAIIISK